ncbi:hypothetical protein [Mesorhizobium sp. WSM3882]|uniref:hypothetical protein n=1 Tax=Mesorhizobium sp. WSM3882 TaxID=2029407 RepID=UPI001AEFBD5F|nr:hypothetical protein [Mesorhizobium sp. WSM3882]
MLAFETKGFHRQIWAKADAKFFFEGRLRFFCVPGEQGGTANALSVLVAYADANGEATRRAAKAGPIRGKLVHLSADREVV